MISNFSSSLRLPSDVETANRSRLKKCRVVIAGLLGTLIACNHPADAPPGGAGTDARLERSAPAAEAELRASFEVASARIREHQQTDGYWLTSFTKRAAFEAPNVEMNTFLTSTLVDILDPVAALGGLEENLKRARTHLASQVESTGLVRYHGRPDGPWIGRLGCAITPDPDDTALVWRIAPPADRRSLPDALSTIEAYRTGEGLYRSWLAPRSEYQCLDPGLDPNPTDVAIQMHLLMLLQKVRPDRGDALCAAIRPLLDEDRIWVYYRRAPLIPMLRVDDLKRGGCDLALPASRERTEIPGQEIWLSVARIVGGITTEARSVDPILTRGILRELARNDFALLRANPPLLYHNDLTASVSRYYWSEDVGYALWMRMYEAYRREDGSHRTQ